MLRLLVLLITFFTTGCAYLEGPRWGMLGDTAEEAYFIDRQSVERLDNGHYQYPVKVLRYLEDKPHSFDESRESDRVIYVEMDCRHRLVCILCNGVMDHSGKVLFRQPVLSAEFEPVPPESIHEAAYGYLCDSRPITPVHLH